MMTSQKLKKEMVHCTKKIVGEVCDENEAPIYKDQYTADVVEN